MTIAPMTDKGALPTTALQKVWIAVRFIVFGVGGFWLLIYSWIVLVVRLLPGGERMMNPFLALLLPVGGAFMMLFGGGQWGRWAYLWVFLSTPIVVSLLLLLSTLLIPLFPNNFSGSEFLDPKLFGIFVFAAPMPISYAIVKRYYRRRDARSPIQKELQ
jgi:hypothetical protein